MVRIMMIGDIVGRPGRMIVKEKLRYLKKKHALDFIIANGENAAGGVGLTKAIADELFNSEIDFLTMGNHTWDKKEIFEFIDYEPCLIRPANYPPGTPGKGSSVVRLKRDLKIGIINLSGRTFLSPLDCPFRIGEELAKSIARETPVIIVDFHAEATSEKIAFGWFMDGKVSAVIGTHTHVQTADERILPGGTGFITDVGMTGPRDSVLGVKTDLVLEKFMTQLPVRFEIASGPAQINAVILDIDESTGRTLRIERVQEFNEDKK